MSRLSCYTDGGNMLWCALDQITAAFGGQGLFGLLLTGMIMFGFYVLSDGDAVVPGVIALLLGGIMVPGLPPQFRTLALSVMFTGGAAALMALLNRTVLNPGV